MSGDDYKVRASRENFDRWLRELRTTPLGQCRQTLFGFVSTGVITEACCLGIGTLLVPGVDARASIGAAFPPDDFAEWLGVAGATGVRYDGGVNLIVDWPRDLRLKVNPDDWISPYTEAISAAELNDEWALTFSQIADVFDYFGIEGVEWAEGGDGDG